MHPWTTARRAIDLHLELVDDEELEELERALLKARATELGEVRRRDIRLTAGYGDATTRDVLDDESRRARIRHDVLTQAARRAPLGARHGRLTRPPAASSVSGPPSPPPRLDPRSGRPARQEHRRDRDPDRDGGEQPEPGRHARRRHGPTKDRPGERRPDRPADVSPGQVRAGGHPDAFWFDGLEGGRLSRRTRQPHPEPQERQHEAQQQRGGLRRDEPQDRQPDDARQHADHGGLTASDGVGHPAADGCGDRAQRRDAEQHEPARLGVPRLELLDKKRHEHQGAMEDHGRPEDPDHGRREGPRREQMRVDGRVLGPALDQHEDRKEHGRRDDRRQR